MHEEKQNARRTFDVGINIFHEAVHNELSRQGGPADTCPQVAHDQLDHSHSFRTLPSVELTTTTQDYEFMVGRAPLNFIQSARRLRSRNLRPRDAPRPFTLERTANGTLPKQESDGEGVMMVQG